MSRTIIDLHYYRKPSHGEPASYSEGFVYLDEIAGAVASARGMTLLLFKTPSQASSYDGSIIKKPLSEVRDMLNALEQNSPSNVDWRDVSFSADDQWEENKQKFPIDKRQHQKPRKGILSGIFGR
jgi:hypothetical protein